jgi:transcriptional regulator with XRE-family HTH domain
VALPKKAASVLRYAIALGSRDLALRKELGLTKTALAKAAGISVRSLGRYLSGERQPPIDARLGLMVAAEDAEINLKDKFKREAKEQGLEYVEGPLPARVSRYKRPKSPLLTTYERSEIIEVDTFGMDEETFLQLVRNYWQSLRRTGKDWNIRLLVEVEVQQYFGRDGPADREIKKSLRGRDFVPIWIPPKPFIFVSNSRDYREATASDMIEELKGHLTAVRNRYGTSYLGRLPTDGGFLKVAFIPYKWGDDESKRRKRGGNRLHKKQGKQR